MTDPITAEEHRLADLDDDALLREWRDTAVVHYPCLLAGELERRGLDE